MAAERVLITGALGCIGAWAVRLLLATDAEVTIFDLDDDAHRMRLIMDDEEIRRVRFLRGDITDEGAVADAFRSARPTHVLHLAGLQIPACRANPALGARVNVVGTVNLFEAARQAGIEHLAYASSIAVYGPAEEYGAGLLTADAPLLPRTLYGVFKQADEGVAQVYWHEHGLSSISLRPYIVYGAGRDQGLTSSPTVAMLAAAAGQPHHIPYGGRADMQYVADVADIFVRAMRTPLPGAAAYNIQGSIVSMAEVIAAIEAVVPELRGQFTFDDQPLPYSAGADDSAVRAALGDLPATPLDQGVAATIELFRTALAKGMIRFDGAG